MSRPSDVSYLAKRRAHWERYRESLAQLEVEDPFREWEKIRVLSETFVESELRTGLRCWYAGAVDHAHGFFRRAILVADRIVAEGKCRANPISEAAYPRNLATVIRDRAYARWLLGESLDLGTIRQAAEYMASWCVTKATDAKRIQDSDTMCHYLHGVRGAMISGDLDYAAKLLRTKHKLRWHHGVERELWTRLVLACPNPEETLTDDVEKFFDRVRDPDFEEKPDGKIPTFIQRDILALETGVIRQMYLVNPSPLDAVDPQAVIAAVAR